MTTCPECKKLVEREAGCYHRFGAYHVWYDNFWDGKLETDVCRPVAHGSDTLHRVVIVSGWVKLTEQRIEKLILLK